MSAFEERLEQIRRMPPGPQRDQAIVDLTRDYENRQALLESGRMEAIGDLRGAMQMPGAQTAGPSSNPFAVAQAPSPLQYAAQALRGYDAINRRRQADEGLEELSQGRERGLGDLFKAGVGAPNRQQVMANRLRQSDPLMGSGFGTLGMDEDELRRLYGMT